MLHLPAVRTGLFSDRSHNRRSGIRTCYLSGCGTPRSWNLLHKRQVCLHPGLLQGWDQHPLFCLKQVLIQMLLLPPGLDNLRLGNLHPGVPAPERHIHFWIQVLLTHGAPGYFRFREVESTRFLTLLPLCQYNPDEGSVFSVLLCMDHRYLLQSPDKDLLQLRHLCPSS